MITALGFLPLQYTIIIIHSYDHKFTIIIDLQYKIEPKVISC